MPAPQMRPFLICGCLTLVTTASKVCRASLCGSSMCMGPARSCLPAYRAACLSCCLSCCLPVVLSTCLSGSIAGRECCETHSVPGFAVQDPSSPYSGVISKFMDVAQARGTGHRAQGTGHRAQGTGHRAQGIGHRAWGNAQRHAPDQ